MRWQTARAKCEARSDWSAPGRKVAVYPLQYVFIWTEVKPGISLHMSVYHVDEGRLQVKSENIKMITVKLSILVCAEKLET